MFNPISQVGLEKFPGKYENTDKIEEAEAILVRSADMHAMELPEKTAAVARAGAGVNNIPIEALGKKGVVVFNTPGANANGVKEMVLAGMLLASRDIVGGIEWLENRKPQKILQRKQKRRKNNLPDVKSAGKSWESLDLALLV